MEKPKEELMEELMVELKENLVNEQLMVDLKENLLMKELSSTIGVPSQALYLSLKLDNKH